MQYSNGMYSLKSVCVFCGKSHYSNFGINNHYGYFCCFIHAFNYARGICVDARWEPVRVEPYVYDASILVRDRLDLQSRVVKRRGLEKCTT